MRSSTPRLVALLVVLHVAGCGDDDTGTPDGSTMARDAAADAMGRPDGTSRRDGSQWTSPADGSVPDAGPPLGDGGGLDVGPLPGDGGGPDGHVTPGPLDPVLVAATIWGSCIPDDGVNRYLGSLYGDLAPAAFYQSDAVIDCLASATDGCAALSRCAGVRFALGASTGCEPSCAGEVLTVCDDDWHFEIDCEKSGMRCDAVAGECVPPDAKRCEESAAGASSCTAEGRPALCDWDGYEIEGPDCAALGLTCGAFLESSSDFRCRGTGGRCASESYGPLSAEIVGTGCAGSQLEACVNGGATTIDCGSIASGFTCQEHAARHFCGLAAECAPGSEDERCDASVLVLCNAGSIVGVDCVSLGFTGCGPRPELGITAGCTPE